MVRAFLLAAALVPVFISSSAFAVTDKQQHAVAKLGGLNGIALQCRYIDQVNKMKMAVVESAPKVRAIGETFDEESNNSFKSFAAKNEACPNKAAFDVQVEAAIMEMQVHFKK